VPAVASNTSRSQLRVADLSQVTSAVVHMISSIFEHTAISKYRPHPNRNAPAASSSTQPVHPNARHPLLRPSVGEHFKLKSSERGKACSGMVIENLGSRFRRNVEALGQHSFGPLTTTRVRTAKRLRQGPMTNCHAY
jgi:hypothetical protein